METARISDDDRIGRNTVPLPQNDTSGLQTAGRNTVVNDRHAPRRYLRRRGEEYTPGKFGDEDNPVRPPVQVGVEKIPLRRPDQVARKDNLRFPVGKGTGKERDEGILELMGMDDIGLDGFDEPLHLQDGTETETAAERKLHERTPQRSGFPADDFAFARYQLHAVALPLQSFRQVVDVLFASAPAGRGEDLHNGLFSPLSHTRGLFGGLPDDSVRRPSYPVPGILLVQNPIRLVMDVQPPVLLMVHRGVMVHDERADTETHQPVFQIGILAGSGIYIPFVEPVGLEKVGFVHGEITPQYPLVTLADEPPTQGRGGNPDTVLHMFLSAHDAGIEQRPHQFPLESRRSYLPDTHSLGESGRQVYPPAGDDEPFPPRLAVFLDEFPVRDTVAVQENQVLRPTLHHRLVEHPVLAKPAVLLPEMSDGERLSGHQLLQPGDHILPRTVVRHDDLEILKGLFPQSDENHLQPIDAVIKRDDYRNCRFCIHCVHAFNRPQR